MKRLPLLLLVNMSCACSSESSDQKPKAVASSAAVIDNTTMYLNPNKPASIVTKLPILRRMDALTISSNTNPNRAAETPDSKAKTPSGPVQGKK